MSTEYRMSKESVSCGTSNIATGNGLISDRLRMGVPFAEGDAEI